jgi:hypothetical protein
MKLPAVATATALAPGNAIGFWPVATSFLLAAVPAIARFPARCIINEKK